MLFVSEKLILISKLPSPDEDNLKIPGYIIFGKDYPSNTKRGQVLLLKHSNF